MIIPSMVLTSFSSSSKDLSSRYAPFQRSVVALVESSYDYCAKSDHKTSDLWKNRKAGGGTVWRKARGKERSG